MTLRILLCVPTYNNSETIEQVVRDALHATACSVLVVDDGSTTPVEGILHASEIAEAKQCGRLHVLRLAENRGKGVALQTGFQWAVVQGFTHVLTVDGDGQHLLSEAQKLIDKAIEHPWDLIIGKRRFEAAADVPGVSKFGRKFSNFWVQYQTGEAIHDSQSGFRLYPLFHLQNWKFWTKRYDFEIEVLIRMLWKGAGIHEVDIEVYYPPEDQRVSHFNKLWDNVRISLLNTVLVVVSLLRHNRSPRKNAFAFGLGLFIGSSPFFGFHTLIVAAVAFFCRLNALLLFAGSNISLPPIAVFLIPLEVLTGRKILLLLGWQDTEAPDASGGMNEILNFAAHHALQWCVGALVIGTVLGIAGGLAFWSLSLPFQNKPKRNWTGRTRGGKFGNGFLKIAIRAFGLRFGYAFLFFLSPYFYLFAPRARRGADEYWAAMSPQAGWWGRQTLILRQMFRFGQVLMDRGYQSFHAQPQFFPNSEGMDLILGATSARQPSILISGHVGSWDIAASLLKSDGYFGRFHMVHYQAKDLTFEKVVESKESLSDVRSMLTNDSPVLQIKLQLEKGEPVGLMADRATNTQVELVSFLGKLMPIDVRPFRIAASCRSQVLFTFGFKGQGQNYDFFAYPAVTIEPRPEASRLRDLASEFAAHLEGLLRKYPEQWFNFYSVFSSVPQPPPGVQGGKERNSLLQEWHKQKPETPVSAPGPTPNAAVEFQH